MAKCSLNTVGSEGEGRKFPKDSQQPSSIDIICKKKETTTMLELERKLPLLVTIKKKTRSLIISVEAQEFVKRHPSAWRTARKSAGVTGPNTPRVYPTALSARLSIRL